ncbi:hypothetical protein M2341_002047 [Sphingobium sp. B7D2B]|uniref:hypothetical protein n=1 Tax=Sphingobium sp. B7D2B TaxID=2940583 RepID=UPI0022254B52|nr:hypothetical protein [Sphingobium sp. B7D2B]MCW2366600.1 hypothetical protein [Sphingobium sp. B7D2B]
MKDDMMVFLETQQSDWVAGATNLPLSAIAQRIAMIADDWAGFWIKVDGWAPAEAAAALAEANLRRVASLAHSTQQWIRDEPLSDGDLVLAWTNLGAVLEGALRLFLTVFLADYLKDKKMLESRAFNKKYQVLTLPSNLTFDNMLDAYEKSELLPNNQLALCRRLQHNRNAIHAFKLRDVETDEAFQVALRELAALMRSLDGRMPRPF